jgi:hypothetical protein
VVTRLISLGVPEDIRKVLVGHADEDVHGSTYVHREQIPLKLLYEHLNKLDFSEALRLLGSGFRGHRVWNASEHIATT